MKHLNLLAVLLLMGGASFARAEQGGAEAERLSSHTAYGIRLAEGPNPALRDDPPAAEPQDAVRKDTPSPADTKAEETNDSSDGDRAVSGDDAPKAEPEGDISQPKATNQEK